MVDNVVDFDSQKLNHVNNRKQAKVDALREAFARAREESRPKLMAVKNKNRNKPKKK